MTGHASAEDTRVLGGLGAYSPQKNFENRDPQIAGNKLKLSILPTPRYFV